MVETLPRQEIEFSAKRFSVAVIAIFGCSVLGMTLGVTAVAGVERLVESMYPVINWFSVGALGEEATRYNPHLVTAETILSTYKNIILPLTLVYGGVAGVVNGFRS